jgi:hypothetical protein
MTDIDTEILAVPPDAIADRIEALMRFAVMTDSVKRSDVRAECLAFMEAVRHSIPSGAKGELVEMNSASRAKNY